MYWVTCACAVDMAKIFCYFLYINDYEKVCQIQQLVQTAILSLVYYLTQHCNNDAGLNSLRGMSLSLSCHCCLSL